MKSFTRPQAKPALLIAAAMLMLTAASSSVRAQSEPANAPSPDVAPDYAQVGNGLFMQKPDTSGVNPDALVPRPQMIGNSYQYAPVYEALYALSKSERVLVGELPTRLLPGWGLTYVSDHDWNYLADDPHAFNIVTGWMGSNRSVDGKNGIDCSTDSSYALQGGYSRGGQCTFFATLIIYRSRSFSVMSKEGFNYGWYWGNPVLHDNPRTGYKVPTALSAQLGDLVFRADSAPHVAVAVQRRQNGDLVVVDSNWAGFKSKEYSVGWYQGFYNSEMIGCHIISVSDQTNIYKTYSGKNRWY